MVQLNLRERLQPALLDRLIDDERLITCYEFSFRRDELVRLGLPERDLVAILLTQGLRPLQSGDRAAARAEPDVLRLTLVGPAGRISLSQLKALVLKPPGKPQGVALQSFCE